MPCRLTPFNFSIIFILFSSSRHSFIFQRQTHQGNDYLADTIIDAALDLSDSVSHEMFRQTIDL